MQYWTKSEQNTNKGEYLKLSSLAMLIGIHVKYNGTYFCRSQNEELKIHQGLSHFKLTVYKRVCLYTRDALGQNTYIGILMLLLTFTILKILTFFPKCHIWIQWNLKGHVFQTQLEILMSILDFLHSLTPVKW